MSTRPYTRLLAIVGIGCAAVAVTFALTRDGCVEIFARAPIAGAHVVTPAVPPVEAVVGWRTNFAIPAPAGSPDAPAGWKLARKPGTRPAVFSVLSDEKTGRAILRMEADKASASLVTGAEGVDLARTPILKWRWRVAVLPDGADGRVREKDDQAIGIYVGSGSAFSNKSVSYRWDTDTPKGSEGTSSYGMGAVKVKWYTVRNRQDARPGAWVVDERNVAEDFRKAWGYVPDDVYISVSCNSQYTGSKAAADLDWIRFVSDGPAPKAAAGAGGGGEGR